MPGTDSQNSKKPVHNTIQTIEHGLLTVLFLALVVLGLAQIGFRNLAGMSLPWADGAMRSIVLWLAMIGSVVATGRLRHIRIDLADRWLPTVAVMWLRRLVFAATAAVCLLLTWTSLEIVALEYEFQAVAFLDLPSWMVQAIVPVGFGLMSARFLAWAVFPPSRATLPVSSQDDVE